MTDRHPCALLVHFRPGEVHGPILDATGQLLVDYLDDYGWHTDDTGIAYAPGLNRTGLWVFEGEITPEDEGLDYAGRWRRPTFVELERLGAGLPIWVDEEAGRG